MTRPPGLRDGELPDDEELRQAVEAFVGSSLGERAVELTSLVRFGTGHSGDTYRATLRSSTYTGDVVMRLSPAGVRIAGPADVGRQGRIMGALKDFGLPAPTVLATDSTGAINGRSIAVMSLVVGEEWHEFADRHSHDATAAAAVSSLKAIQTLPLSQTGISGEQPFGPAGEIDRWVPLLERSPASIQDDGMALHAALHRALARSDPGAAPVLVHGDYHFGNLLFGEGSVVAVFDWEIAGLGHPLTDLGCLAVAALRRRYEPEPNPTGSVEVSVERLAELYGADLDVTSWHVAASCFKYAAILGYNLQLSRRGRLNEPIYENLQNTMAGLLGDGRAILADGVHGI